MKDEMIDLKTRTKAFALEIVKVYSKLSKSVEAQVLGKQMLRSGTSVGAHYREAMRARSVAEFISKIEGGLQELEETQYWLELLQESEIIPANEIEAVVKEAEELIRILVACSKNAKKRKTS